MFFANPTKHLLYAYRQPLSAKGFPLHIFINIYHWGIVFFVYNLIKHSETHCQIIAKIIHIKIVLDTTYILFIYTRITVNVRYRTLTRRSMQRLRQCHIAYIPFRERVCSGNPFYCLVYKHRAHSQCGASLAPRLWRQIYFQTTTHKPPTHHTINTTYTA